MQTLFTQMYWIGVKVSISLLRVVPDYNDRIYNSRQFAKYSTFL